MNCLKCGTQNPDGARFCNNCGAALTPPPPPPPPASNAPQPQMVTERTSGLSMAALICGIIGLFMNPMSVVAIILGALGLSETSKDPSLKGRGMAVAGIVLGIVAVIVWIIVFAVAGSIFWWRRRYWFW